MGRLRDLGRPRYRPKQYDIIYADPPWEFGIYVTGNRCPENHYPTMATDDICRLPVKDIAARDAVLFLWTTNGHLEEAFQVIEAWGFTYKSNMVWAKDKIGLGYYSRTQHEPLLIATRGNIGAPKPGNRPPSVINSPRRRHSQKPDDVVYEHIERMYPGRGPKLELFARNTRAGRHAWGNEIPNSLKFAA